MAKKEKGTLVGLLLMLGCVVYSGGLSAGWNMIKTCADAVAGVMKLMLSLAMQFPDELGITDWLWTRGIFASVAIVCAFLGYTLTRKSEKKLLGTISTVVSLISTILTFA